MELLLQGYEQARAAAKQEITQARARLQERTEQEKLRIRRQIISQLRRVGKGVCLEGNLEPGTDLAGAGATASGRGAHPRPTSSERLLFLVSGRPRLH